MQSLKELFKVGNGPSSSHTMGPERAARLFKEKYQDATKYIVILYGSLAQTGEGHLTDKIILKTLSPINTEIIFDKEKETKVHPNTMDLIAYKNEEKIGEMTIYSVGGGTIKIKGAKEEIVPSIYPITTYSKIKEYCIQNKKSLCDYVYEIEQNDIRNFLRYIWEEMKKAINRGLNSEGLIPGRLETSKKAKNIFNTKIQDEEPEFKRTRLITSYAYAVAEENASGGIIVTAPTCGASGVVPAVLYYAQNRFKFSDEEIIDALAIAGLIGNIVKTNASISGAECGCQAEIGTACSMAAAAFAYLNKMSLDQIESAAEIAMEHHLGLTCDPIYGYVQIPCIERNAVAAIRAIDASNIAKLVSETNKISFDTVIETMYETGKDLNMHYRETSKGGLAKKYIKK